MARLPSRTGGAGGRPRRRRRGERTSPPAARRGGRTARRSLGLNGASAQRVVSHCAEAPARSRTGCDGACRRRGAREAQAGTPAGGFVARVTRTGGTYFTLDGGNNVASTGAGTTYTATAWVKAASASSIGKPIQIKLRERTPANVVA